MLKLCEKCGEMTQHLVLRKVKICKQHHVIREFKPDPDQVLAIIATYGAVPKFFVEECSVSRRPRPFKPAFRFRAGQQPNAQT